MYFNNLSYLLINFNIFRIINLMTKYASMHIYASMQPCPNRKTNLPKEEDDITQNTRQPCPLPIW